MAGYKRKIPPSANSQNDNIVKRPKKVEVSTQKKPVAQDLEAQTDSDPIVESDTNEESGIGDGASWPSDNEPLPSHNRKVIANTAQQQPGDGLTEKAKAGPLGIAAEHPPSSSREAHAKQKALAHERKAAKPKADSIARTKKLWERLRRKSHVPLEERKTLIEELFSIITGQVKDFVLKHDSVRVIQTAIKYANLPQRKMIATELKGNYRALSESRYAKFLIGKLLVHGDKDVRDLIVPEFYGHVRRLIKHPEASWILDDIYRGAATPTQKANFLREWYGAEFAIFKSQGEGATSADLGQILAQHPEKRKPIMHALHDLINLLVQKRTTGFTMLHDAMLQYFLNVPPNGEEATDFIELLKGDEEGDLLKNLAFTKSGSRVVCLAFAYSSAKDRKLLLRTYKGTIHSMAFDANGHQVILAALDVIDDTVLTSKSIISELLSKSSVLDENQLQNLLTAVIDLKARIPILYPFTGKSKAILPLEDLELLSEIHAIRAATSKKDPEVRRKELLAYLSPPLLSLIAAKPEVLVQSSFGCQCITEVLLSATGDRGPALTALIALTDGSSQEVEEALNTPAAGRMLKTLVQGGRFNPKTKAVDLTEPPLGFHDLLFKSLQKQEKVMDWATGGSSFVVLAMLESKDFNYKQELEKILKEQKKLIATAADDKSAGEKRNGKKGKGDQESSTGNRGCQLLLEKLAEEG